MHIDVKPLSIFPDVFLLRPKRFGDDRGYFYEMWNNRSFSDATNLIVNSWCQDNISWSKPGVLRGLHYQIPQAQGKLVHVLSGEIYDVVVDIRRSSSTFGRWVGVNLSSESDNDMLWIPEGFAHGFYTITTAKVCYKVTNHRVPKDERIIRWDDPDLKISWPSGLTGFPRPLVSDRDAAGQRFREAEVFE